MKKIFWLAVALVVIALGAYVFFRPSRQMQASTPADQQSAAQLGTVTEQSAQVLIKNFSFTPQTITIKAGTKVTWTNQDSAIHTVSSSQFESGSLSTGQTFEHTFNTPGSYEYHCSIHPMMKGTVVVQ